MKIIGTLLVIFLAAAAYVRRDSDQLLSLDAKQQAIKYKKKYALSCSPDLATFKFEDSAQAIPLLEGWGNYRMAVTTRNDSARIYFEQGINMYYGFHIIEALASFSKAVAFDSSFAMGYWGKALSYGPNINDYGYSASPDALDAMQKAKELSTNCSSVEKGLINAIQVRYSSDTTQMRDKLDQLYATAMENLYADFPENADAATLYADALMVQHPWDLYDNIDYTPKSWTPRIVTLLETILKRFPDHPGAAHYYIHAIEASAHPEKGLAVADKLPVLMPEVAHVVHMPSHIYIRTGIYDKGAAVNEKAIKGYYNYAGKFPAVTNNTPLYLIHNLHMQATCANMEGRFKEALSLSIAARHSFDTAWQSIPGFFGIAVQYLYMTPVLTMIRFGKWDSILSEPESPENYVYANLLWHYARGLAHARKHDFEKAEKEIAAVRKGLLNDQLKAPAPSYANPGINGATVAEKILAGVIAEEQNNLPSAIITLKQAVMLEDAMIYDEPKDWVHPARQYLGNVLLKAKRFTEAASVFENDLRMNPNNGWSLTGLTIALEKQNRKKEAAAIKLRAQEAFSRSELVITAPVF